MKFCFECFANLNELAIFYSPWNLRANDFLMISGEIEVINKFFKFTYLKGIKFCGINYCGINFCDSSDLFLQIRCKKKTLWSLFLLVGDLQDFYECLAQKLEIKQLKTKKRHCLQNLLLRMIIRQCFGNLFSRITKNDSILRNLFLRFRDKSAKINSALINFEKINPLKVIFKGSYGNIAKSWN